MCSLQRRVCVQTPRLLPDVAFWLLQQAVAEVRVQCRPGFSPPYCALITKAQQLQDKLQHLLLRVFLQGSFLGLKANMPRRDAGRTRSCLLRCAVLDFILFPYPTHSFTLSRELPQVSLTFKLCLLDCDLQWEKV